MLVSYLMYFLNFIRRADGEAYNVCNESQFVSILELIETIAELISEQGLKIIHKERNSEEVFVENIHME